MSVPTRDAETTSPPIEPPYQPRRPWFALPRPGIALLDRSDSLVYFLVGVCFLGVALLSLIYGVVKFLNAMASAFAGGHVDTTTAVAQAIVNFVSDLLLTLIIMEVLGTVVHYLRRRETSLRPFLFIGIISAVRSILATGARLSISDVNTLPQQVFYNTMIELATDAIVIVALGITMRLIGSFLDDSFEDHPVADNASTRPVADTTAARSPSGALPR